MAETKSVWLDNHHIDAIEDLSESPQADSESEAHKLALSTGLRELGYINGQKVDSDTKLRGVVQELSRLFGYTALGYTAVAYVFNAVTLYQWVVLLAILSLACLYADQLLGQYEPDLSKRLLRLMGRDTA